MGLTDAQTALLKRAIPIADKLAHVFGRYKDLHVREDLAQIGLTRMIEVIPSYDPALNPNFERYAVMHMTYAITDDFNWTARQRKYLVILRNALLSAVQIGRGNMLDEDHLYRREVTVSQVNGLRASTAIAATKIRQLTPEDIVTQEIAKSSVHDALYAAIEELPAVERALIKRTRLGDESVRAVATDLRMSPRDAYDRVGDALNRLAYKLGGIRPYWELLDKAHRDGEEA